MNGLRSYYNANNKTLTGTSGSVVFTDAAVGSLTPNTLTASDDSNTLVSLPQGTSGQVLTSNGAGVKPSWVSGTATASSLAGGAAGQVPYQSAPSSTDFTATGTAGQILASGGMGPPTWKSTTGSGNVVQAIGPTISGATLVNPNIGTATGTSLSLSGLSSTSAVATDAFNMLVSVTNTGSGNNVLAASPTLVTPDIGAATASSLKVTSLTASRPVFTDSSDNLVSATTTGSGSVVLSVSPSLTTPSLGVASATSLSVSGLTGTSAVATDSSKNLVSVANTGSGNNVLAISPTLVTPVLGAASATSLSVSGLTVSSAVATDASKNLVSVANTGSGNNVLATSPTLITPAIGAATGSSLVVSSVSYSPLITNQTGAGDGTGLVLNNTVDGTSVYIALSNSSFQTGACLISTSLAKDIFLAPNAVTAMRLKSGGLINIPGLTASTIVGTDASKNLVSFSTIGSGSVVLAANGTSGQLLTSNGSTAPFWASPATTIANLSGGSAGVVPYQTAPSTTDFTAAGSVGEVLVSGGTGAPTWASPTYSSFYGQYTVLSGTVVTLGLAVAANTADIGTLNAGLATTNTNLAIQTTRVNNLSNTVYNPVAANTFYAGPTSGTLAPTYRTIDPSDIANFSFINPNINSAIGTSLSLSGAGGVQALELGQTTGASKALQITSPNSAVVPTMKFQNTARAISATLGLATSGDLQIAASSGVVDITSPNINNAVGTSLNLTGSGSTATLQVAHPSAAPSGITITSQTSGLPATLEFINSFSAKTADIGLNTSGDLQISASTGKITIPALTASNIVATDASKNLVSIATTGTAGSAVVLATSPTITNSLAINVTGAAAAIAIVQATSGAVTGININSPTAGLSIGLGDTGTGQSGCTYVNASSGKDIFLQSAGTTLMRLKSTGVVQVGNLTASNIVATDASSNLTSVATTGTAGSAVVLATSPTITSPTLVTPVLGAASASSLTVTGLTASNIVATDASKNLVSVATTGTAGSSVVLATSPTITSPTLVTPVLGAAAATSLSVSGLTASYAVQTDASRNLVSLANTGSGNNVLAVSPVIVGAALVTPVLGVATATSLAVTGTIVLILTLGLTASSSVQTDASKTLVSLANTGSGNNVLATSPTIVAPTITGTTTMADVNASNINLSGLTANAAVATDAGKFLYSIPNTGNGNNVLATAPTIAAPTLTGTVSGTGVVHMNSSSYSPFEANTSISNSGTGLYLTNSADGNQVYLALSNNGFQQGACLIQTTATTGYGKDIFLAPNAITAMRVKANATSAGIIQIPGLTASSLVATDASSNLVSTNNYSRGTLPLQTTISSGTGTFTTSSGCRYYKVTVTGGGGGGGAGGVYLLTYVGGGGGGAGGTVILYVSTTSYTSFTYSIGAGGGSSTNGGNTTATFSGTTVQGDGGVFGLNGALGLGGSEAGAGGAGGNGSSGSFSNTVVTIGGGGGAGTGVYGSGGGVCTGGVGGASFWGGGGKALTSQGDKNGNNGGAYGSGASGGMGGGVGGTGQGGVIVVEEFY